MAAIFSDQDISRLIQERKTLPDDYRTKIQTRPKLGHKERELDIKGADGERKHRCQVYILDKAS